MKRKYSFPQIKIEEPILDIYCQVELSTDNPTDIPGTEYTGEAGEDDEAGAKQNDNKLWQEGW